MSKAFDSIIHEILILKLQDVGVSNPVIQWFWSYLNLLRPLLFGIYTNEPPPTPQKFSIDSYPKTLELVSAFKFNYIFNLNGKLVKDFVDSKVFYDISWILE